MLPTKSNFDIFSFGGFVVFLFSAPEFLTNIV